MYFHYPTPSNAPGPLSRRTSPIYTFALLLRRFVIYPVAWRTETWGKQGPGVWAAL